MYLRKYSVPIISEKLIFNAGGILKFAATAKIFPLLVPPPLSFDPDIPTSFPEVDT